MRRRRSEIAVFSISALDLFAAALGAFILIVLVLFPYYRLGGTDVSMEELEELVKKRRLVASSAQSEMAKIRAIQAEIRLLNKQYKSTQANMSEVSSKLDEVLRQTASVTIPDPPPIPKAEPEPDPAPDPDPPRSVASGVEFSILGLATNKKKIALVVDMSGSMKAHRDKVTTAIHEILDQMKPDNRFVIIGYRGGPTFDTFPPSSSLVPATAQTLASARKFVDGLSRRFGGGTPTQTAMIRTLNLKPEAIILMSDGAPDDGALGSIIANVTARNRGRSEIHTVAIGEYTQDRKLTLFLQELAKRNRGDFVGRAR